MSSWESSTSNTGEVTSTADGTSNIPILESLVRQDCDVQTSRISEQKLQRLKVPGTLRLAGAHHPSRKGAALLMI